VAKSRFYEEKRYMAEDHLQAAWDAYQREAEEDRLEPRDKLLFAVLFAQAEVLLRISRQLKGEDQGGS
jgi:hypothetical protein